MAAASPDSDPGFDATDVVAIDGPSGAGKSTVAKALARRLGYRYLDTGAMYRSVTWWFLLHQVPVLGGEHDARTATDLDRLLGQMDLRLLDDGVVQLNGEDITTHIRSREVESRVSAVSAMPVVRRYLRRLQRAQALQGPLVAEGRDMASVVFPAARWKVFLDAEPEERARRRLGDFERRGRDVAIDQVLDEILVRDRLDSNRKDAPLTRTKGAYYFDTTGNTLDQVVEWLAAFVEAGNDREEAAESRAEGSAKGDTEGRSP